MADVNGDVLSLSAPGSEMFEAPVAWFSTDTLTVPFFDVYKMRGRDANCVSLTYRFWEALNAADFTGAQYSGSFCGVSVSLVEIAVIGFVRRTF